MTARIPATIVCCVEPAIGRTIIAGLLRHLPDALVVADQVVPDQGRMERSVWGMRGSITRADIGVRDRLADPCGADLDS